MPENHSAGGVRRPLPPFGRDAAGRSGWTLRVYVGGGAWDAARAWPRGVALVAPSDRDPTVFDWRPAVQVGHALVLRAGPVEAAHLRRLVAALFRDGAAEILVLDRDDRIPSASYTRGDAGVAA